MSLREPNCAGYIARRGSAAFHVVSKCDDWYQDGDAFVAAGVIAERAPRTKLVAFGVSMGGFGALLYSPVYKPQIMVVGCPQVVVDHGESLGRDDRWRREWSALDIRRPVAEPWSGSKVYLAYDPYVPEDRWHVSTLKSSIVKVKMPFSGHEIFGCLTRTGAWVDFMDACVSDDAPEVERLRLSHLRNRRSRPEYVEALEPRWRIQADHARLEQVKALYETYFGRRPTGDEERYWMGEGRSRRLSDLHAVLLSEPWSDQPITAAISTLYRAHLGRDARPSELEGWSRSVKRGSTLEHLRNTLVREAQGQT